MDLPKQLQRLSMFYCQPYPKGLGQIVQPGIEMVELVTQGKGQVLNAGQWVPVEAGTLLWHVAGDMTIGRTDHQDPYVCMAMHFQVADMSQRRVPHISHWMDTDEARQFARESFRYFVDDTFDAQTMMIYIYSRLYFQARLYHYQLVASNAPIGLTQVMQVIDQRYHEPLLLDDLAGIANWSVAHLHDVFKQHTGTSPHQALLRRRLHAAREKLIATNDCVKTIAHLCGFNSAASFCRTFKQITGQTPTNYRQQHAHLK
ncbi:MAG: helix-turn-helix transcriptional regulator [Phycisphaeraceae bacterium]|nr:helix-turn-helix transcriptional regulator [Phycisphaeraceae bacterium]